MNSPHSSCTAQIGRGGGMAKSVGTLVSGNGLSQVILLAGMVGLSYLYNPAQFGKYAIVLGVATIVGATSTLRFEMTILMPRSPALAMLALQVSVLLALIVNLSFLVVIMGLVRFEIVATELWVAPFVSLSLALISCISFSLNRARRYVALAALPVARSTIFVICGMAFGLANVTDGLIYSLMLSVGLTMSYLFWAEFIRTGIVTRWPTHRRFMYWVRRNKKFYQFSTPAVFVGSLAGQAPVFLLSAFYGSGVAGLYSMTSRLLMAPVNLLSAAINKIYMQKVANNRANGMKISRFTMRLVKVFSLASAFLSAVLYFAIDFGILGWIFDDKWSGLGSLVMLMVPVMAVSFVAKTVAGFAVLGRNEVGLAYQLILLFGVSTAIIAANHFSNDVSFVVGAISLALSLIYLGQIGSVLRISARLDRGWVHL